MLFSTTSSQQSPTTPAYKSILGPYNFRHLSTKILQKMKLSKRKETPTPPPKSISADIQIARFVTFTRPTDAPQIIDLKALRRNIPPPPNQTAPTLRVHTSTKTVRSSTEKASPLLRDAQQVPVLDAEDEFRDYELLDGDGKEDVDWSLLDLPEAVYRRLANDSCHSLI